MSVLSILPWDAAFCQGDLFSQFSVTVGQEMSYCGRLSNWTKTTLPCQWAAGATSHDLEIYSNEAPSG